ncbi:MAG: T9SS type A sorting domain-containing protein [Ignavibacteria bacterium]|nr:T9SS type A sorting domain-containing protein [Ignavibacteria bacterium]
MVFNTRFSPTERCTLRGIILGFSLVKFDPVSTNDSLVVYVYESGTVPPLLLGVGRTFTYNLGDQGVPAGNIQFSDPLSSGAREEQTFLFPSPIVFSPRREFIVGVKVVSTQTMALGKSAWNGFTVVVNRAAAEWQRYRRYMITVPASSSVNAPVASANNASMYFRAIVDYDAALPPTTLTHADGPAEALGVEFRPNHPNPFSASTTFDIALAAEQPLVLTVHDALGREVARPFDGTLAAGMHAVPFDARARGLASGLYIARLATGAGTMTRAVLLAR